MKIGKTVNVLLLATATACSSSSSTPKPAVSQQGKHRVWYQGPEIEAELTYSWAAKHLGDEWLVLKLAFAGSDGTVEVKRSDILIRSPDGSTIQLLDQKEFKRVYGQLRMAISRTDAWVGGSVRFWAERRPCGSWFLGPPGTMAVGHGAVYASPFEVCGGPIVFHVPTGVQPGPWVLTIDLEESEARIPFMLEGQGLD